MNHIGSIINKYRCNLEMSRKKLAENICSEKYLYLIEKGERTPSTEIVRHISLKLGINLFKYYEYLDCIDPVNMYETIELFNTYRRIADFQDLKLFSDTISELPDFQNKPWSYELAVNNISYSIFVEHQYLESIAQIYGFIKTVEPKYLEEEFMVNLYLLLSTCYQVFGDVEKAEEALLVAKKLVENKQNIPKFSQAIISTKLNSMTLCHLNGKYDLAIEEGLWINRFSLETNFYERANFTYYYLAYAYYKKGMIAEAFDWFEKCMYDLLIHYCKTPAYYISNYDLFYVFFNDEKISRDLAEKIRKQYDFI